MPVPTFTVDNHRGKTQTPTLARACVITGAQLNIENLNFPAVAGFTHVRVRPRQRWRPQRGFAKPCIVFKLFC